MHSIMKESGIIMFANSIKRSRLGKGFVITCVFASVLYVVNRALGLLPTVLFIAECGFFFYAGLQVTNARSHYIRDYEWPPGLLDRFTERYPSLTPDDRERVSLGLKQFFAARATIGNGFIPMPSKVVDSLWHEFIAYTRAYADFCDKAFGAFYHHTPSIAMEPDAQRDDAEGARGLWRAVCAFEGIDPRDAKRLPLLFALDADLNIPGGLHQDPHRWSVYQAGERPDDGSASHVAGGGDWWKSHDSNNSGGCGCG